MQLLRNRYVPRKLYSLCSLVRHKEFDTVTIEFYHGIIIVISKLNYEIIDTKLPSNKRFGYFFLYFLCFFSIFFVNNWIWFYTFSSLTLVFFALSVIKAELLLLNKLWMSFGYLLGKVIRPFVLGVIFFVLITPIAILMRLAGRDELRLK